MILTQSPLYAVKKSHWENFTLFSEYINDESLKNNWEIFFEGHGYFEFLEDNFIEKYFLFKINNRLFASVLQGINNIMHFEGVFEFELNILKTNFFSKQHKKNKYKELEAKILIDCRTYDYDKDHRLYLSQKSKVDLLFTHQLMEETNATLKVVILPSLKQAVDWQVKVDLIHTKTAQVIAEREKKKKT